MADDIDEAADDRAVELASLAAIYPELVRDSANPFCASIDIPVEPIKEFAILFPNAPIEQPTQDVHLLSYLPPLTLHITLPDGYPSLEPPLFSLSSESSWIPPWRLQLLRDAGGKLWENIGRDQVVFTYIDSLREAAEDGFNLTNHADGHLRVSQDLKLALLDFDLKAKRTKFEQETFNCSICLEPKKGVKCHKLSLCGHVFCVACLQDFFNSCITEGDVNNVKCIAPTCGEVETLPRKKNRNEDRTLDPSELLQVPLSQEQVKRYITLKRKKRYDADPTTVYCPRTWCQGPARTKASETAEALVSEDEVQSAETEPTMREERDTGYVAPADRLAICQDCNFAFCQVCKASWHGEFIWCSTRNKGELSAEEKASEEYLQLHSTPCPTCNAPCQKSMGCNHMTCPTCKSHFCYLCSSWLDKDNPYKHYNDEKNPCYMRLWELEGGDGGEGVGIGFGGGIGDGFVDFDDDSDVSDSDFSEEESDDEDLPPPPPPRAPAARGRGRGGVRGGQRGQGDRVGGVGRGGRGGAPNVQVNARVQAGLQRAAPVANRGNDPVLPMQEFLAAAL